MNQKLTKKKYEKIKLQIHESNTNTKYKRKQIYKCYPNFIDFIEITHIIDFLHRYL